MWSGDTDLEEAGDMTETGVLMRGERTLSGLPNPSDSGVFFVLGTGEMAAFGMMVILCFGEAPLVGMTAVLV